MTTVLACEKGDVVQDLARDDPVMGTEVAAKA